MHMKAGSWEKKERIRVLGKKILVQWSMGLCLALGLPSVSEAGQWRWALGAQLDPASHGIVDIGYRAKGLSIELLTDTLDLRYRHRVERDSGK